MSKEQKVLVSFKDVKVSFKRGIQERVVIEGLDLDIFEGEILGLVGESGSGKTTIGRTLIRIVPVAGGEILYRGERISGKISRAKQRELKTKVQMIFQDPSASLNERSNVDYIISEGLRAFKLYENDEERIKKLQI